MLKGFSTRIIALLCTVLFLLALLIPFAESWADNVIEAACSSGSSILGGGSSILGGGSSILGGGSSILGGGSSIIRTDGTNRA